MPGSMDRMGIGSRERRFGRSSRLRRAADPRGKERGRQVIAETGVLGAQSFNLGSEEATGAEVGQDPHGGGSRSARAALRALAISAKSSPSTLTSTQRAM